jgi:RNA polymerase sigma-70 factor, ECF subfamily
MDGEFLSRLKSGDDDAFDALVREHQRKVIAICLRFLRNPDDAEDTAQDVFVEVYRALSGFRQEAELSTWIYRIAVTKSLDSLRRRKRKKRGDGLMERSEGGEAVESLPADRAGDPERLLEAGERARMLEQALVALPEKQRIAVTLAKYDGLEHKDIAGILETTIDAVESLIGRAYGNLRRQLRREVVRRMPHGGKK